MGSTALYDALSAKLGVPTDDLAAGDRLGGADLPAGAGVLRPRRRGGASPGARSRPTRSRSPPPRRDVGAGAGARRRPPRPRRDGRGGHRPHPRRAGLHAQQPDRTGRHPDRARRLPREGARRTCWWWSTRRTSSSSGWTTRSTASRPTAATPNVRAHPHLLQGLRAGRLPGRVRRRRRRRSPAALRAVSLPFGVSGVAQAAAVASLEREPELLERVEALVAERDRVVAGLRRGGLGRPGAAGQLRLVRAGRADRSTSPRPPTRSASWSARSPARAPG